MAVLRAQGTLAAVTLAAGDLEAATRWVAAADALRAQQSLEEYWMGSLATAVAGQLAAEAGELEQARERLERAVVLALRGAARARAHLRARGAGARPVDAGGRRRGGRHIAQRPARTAGVAQPGDVRRTCSTTSSRRLKGKADATGPAEVEELSAREMSVLRLLCSELSIADIGQQLYISRNTVKTHVRGIYRKLDADTRAVAVARAKELRLL